MTTNTDDNKKSLMRHVKDFFIVMSSTRSDCSDVEQFYDDYDYQRHSGAPINDFGAPPRVKNIRRRMKNLRQRVKDTVLSTVHSAW